MHRPQSKLISALRNNSDTLMRLTSEFKFEAPKMKIITFYETKPISGFSRLVSTRDLGSVVLVTYCSTRLLKNIPRFWNWKMKTLN